MRYFLRLSDPALARGEHPELSFRAVSADGFSEELQHALRDNTLFQRWRAMQPDPDAVADELGATDPNAKVDGSQSHLAIDLVATTSLPARLVTQRLRWLAGSHWTMRDVTG
ncbi:MAG: hypothetical protein KDJ14_06640 [Xanthomonadales bacterium]|nr:hypothetical protein [Xanthomonadales bacterium]